MLVAFFFWFDTFRLRKSSMLAEIKNKKNMLRRISGSVMRLAVFGTCDIDRAPLRCLPFTCRLFLNPRLADD